MGKRRGAELDSLPRPRIRSAMRTLSSCIAAAAAAAATERCATECEATLIVMWEIPKIAHCVIITFLYHDREPSFYSSTQNPLAVQRAFIALFTPADAPEIN